jgi:hypothetical protein
MLHKYLRNICLKEGQIIGLPGAPTCLGPALDVGIATSEISVYFNETTQSYIPEGYHLHTPYPEIS